MKRITLLLLLLILPTASSLLQARSVLNFPRLSFDKNTLTGIAIVNPTDQPANITVTAYGNDGRLLAGTGFQNPAPITVAANQQKAMLTSELFGSGVDPSTVAWFQATSSVDGLVGFFLFLNPAITQFDGADLPDAALKIAFNQIRIDAGYSTEINIINPGDSVANLELRLMSGGAVAAVRTLSLPAKGVTRSDAASFFNVSALSPGAYLIVSSDREIAGFESVKTANGDLLGLNARNTSEQLAELNFPQMAVLGLWKTEIGVVNYSNTQVTLTITAFRPDGTPYAPPAVKNNPVGRTLDAGASLREDVESMFGFAGNSAVDGWIKVGSSAAALNGYVTYGIPSVGSVAAVSGSGQGRTRAIFSHLATAQGFYNGVAILNPSTSAAAKSAASATNVRVMAIRPDGQVLGTYDTALRPGQRITKLIDELIPQAAGQGGGLIWVKSDFPVNLTSLFGTTSGAVLANIPAQPAPDAYNPDSSLLADLSVTKSAAPNPVNAGNSLTYTILVTNNGPSAATSVVLTDNLPPGATLVSASATQGSCAQSAGSLTCNLGTLADKAVATVTIFVTPTAAGTITNTAGVRGNETDPNMADNTATVSTTVSASSANLSISKSGPSTCEVGDNCDGVTYRITVTNGGPDSATGVTITDTLPVDPPTGATVVTFVSATPSRGTCSGVSGGAFTCNLGSLSNGGTATVTVVINIDSTAIGRVITNRVSVASTTPDPNTANNIASTDMKVTPDLPETDLEVTTLTDSPDPATVNSNLTYTATVVNKGRSTATGVTVTDALPAGASFVSATSTQGTCLQSAGTVTCSLGTLAKNSPRTVTIVVRPTTQGTIINTVRVSSSSIESGTEIDPVPTNNSATVSTTVIGAIDLSITKSHSGNFPLGGTGVYTIGLQNVGTAPTTGVITVTDTLPAGLGFVSGSSLTWSCSAAGQTVTCANGGPLVAGASTSVSLTVSVSASAASSVTNTATVSTPGDTNTANNSASDPTTTSSSASLSVAKTGPSNCSIGSNCDGITYTITVSNSGPSAATGVTLTDTLPVDPPTGLTVVTFVSAKATQGSCAFPTGGAFTCNLGTLNNASSATVTAVVNVDSTALGRTITNSVRVSSGVSDPNPANNTASSSMNVTPIPAETDLEVTTLTDSPDPVSLSAANHDITYAASVINKGRSTATQVKVTDVLPGGMTFVSASSSQGSCSFGSNTITCNLGTLVKNSPKTITIVLRPTTTGVKTNTVSISSTSISNGTEDDPVSSNNSKTTTTQVNP